MKNFSLTNIQLQECRISYKDEDGDKVDISSQRDYEQALQYYESTDFSEYTFTIERDAQIEPDFTLSEKPIDQVQSAMIFDSSLLSLDNKLKHSFNIEAVKKLAKITDQIISKKLLQDSLKKIKTIISKEKILGKLLCRYHLHKTKKMLMHMKNTAQLLAKEMKVIEENELKDKQEKNKRIMQKLNNKLHESVQKSIYASQMKMSQQKLEENYQFDDEMKNVQKHEEREYEKVLETMKSELTDEIEKKMQQFIEDETTRMKKELIAKTLCNNRALMNTYVDKLNTFEKKRQNFFNSEMSKLSTQSNVAMSVMPSNVIHTNIECSICKNNPIIGIRYKCTVCPSFNLCESCEESNNNKSPHPHNFIKIRNPEKLNNNLIKNESEKYSFECLTKNLTLFADKSKFQSTCLIILLKNNHGMSWGNAMLICDKINSNICFENIMLPNCQSEQQAQITVPFKGINLMKVGTYTAIGKFSVNNEYYGKDIIISVNITDSDQEAIQNLRKTFE